MAHSCTSINKCPHLASCLKPAEDGRSSKLGLAGSSSGSAAACTCSRGCIRVNVRTTALTSSAFHILCLWCPDKPFCDLLSMPCAREAASKGDPVAAQLTLSFSTSLLMLDTSSKMLYRPYAYIHKKHSKRRCTRCNIWPMWPVQQPQMEHHRIFSSNTHLPRLEVLAHSLTVHTQARARQREEAALPSSLQDSRLPGAHVLESPSQIGQRG